MRLEAEFDPLAGLLQQWNKRRRWRDGLLWLPRGLLAGLLAAVLIATAARFRPWLHSDQLAAIALVLGLAGALIAALLLWLRRDSLVQQARMADRQFHLQERLSTAVELRQGVIDAPSTMVQEQLADTRAAIRQIDIKAALPLRLDRRDWLMISLAAVLLAAAVLLPNPQSEALKKRQAVAASIKEQVAALEELRNEISDNPALTAAEREELLRPLEEALEALSQEDLSQEGAVAALSEAEAELRQLGNQFSKEGLRQALRDAGQSLAENPAGRNLGESLQNGDLSGTGAAAAQLADALPQLSAGQQADLAADLAETARALEGVDDELAQQLAQAAQALQEGDVAAAQQALRDAAGTLQQRAQAAAAAQQAQAAADQLSQGRQGIAQAGSPTQGSGQGQGQGQGQGSGDGDAQGLGQGQGVETEQGEGVGGPGPGGGHAENLYVPDFADLSGETGVEIELPAECLANPANCGGLLSETATEFSDESSSVPYDQVFGDYRNAAYEALADDYIPLGLKGYVRDYFSSLEP